MTNKRTITSLEKLAKKKALINEGPIKILYFEGRDIPENYEWKNGVPFYNGLPMIVVKRRKTKPAAT